MFIAIAPIMPFDLIAQQSTPADIELLTKQLEFLKESQGQFIQAITIIFTVLGIAGGFAAFFFGKSFKDFQDFAKENIRDIHDFSESALQDAVERVRKKAETEVAYIVDNEAREIVRAEVRNVERILRRERVVSSTNVDYYLPGNAQEPREVELLRAREFNNVMFFNQADQLRPSSSNVVVLDLIHFETAEHGKFVELNKPKDAELRDAIAKPMVEDLLQRYPESVVLIVYVNSFPRLGCIDVVPEGRYVLAANSPITVVGNSADGAYVARGARQILRTSE